MSYKKSCRDCGQEITMSDETGKWKAYNGDGSAHMCNSKTSNGNGKKEYTLDEVQKKLETLGIIINVDRLMAS